MPLSNELKTKLTMINAIVYFPTKNYMDKKYFNKPFFFSNLKLVNIYDIFTLLSYYQTKVFSKLVKDTKN